MRLFAFNFLAFFFLLPLVSSKDLPVTANQSPSFEIELPQWLTSPLKQIELDFVDACRRGDVATAKNLERAVPRYIVAAEYIRAFFQNQPDVAWVLRRMDNVEKAASGMIFSASLANSVERQIDNLADFFVSADPSEERDSVQLLQANRDLKPPPTKEVSPKSASDAKFRFSVLGAATISCHLRNPLMISALLGSRWGPMDSIWNRNLLAYVCVDQMTQGNVDAYRPDVTGSWKTVRTDGGARFLRALLANNVLYGQSLSLARFAINADRPDLLAMIVHHDDFDIDAREKGLLYAVKQRKLACVNILMGEPDRALPYAFYYRPAILAAAVQVRDATLDAVARHSNYYKVHESYRWDILISVFGHHKKFADIQAIFKLIKVPEKHVLRFTAEKNLDDYFEMFKASVQAKRAADAAKAAEEAKRSTKLTWW